HRAAARRILAVTSARPEPVSAKVILTAVLIVVGAFSLSACKTSPIGTSPASPPVGRSPAYLPSPVLVLYGTTGPYRGPGAHMPSKQAIWPRTSAGARRCP